MLPLDRLIPQQFEELKPDLSDMYKEIAANVNGYIGEWTPTVRGSVAQGAGTYTAASTSGLYYRQGVLVDIWFRIKWTAHTGTGNLQIDLPYAVSLSAQDFCTGILETTGISLSANYTWATTRAISDSMLAAVIECGSGQTAQAKTIMGAADIRGHMRYIGQELT